MRLRKALIGYLILTVGIVSGLYVGHRTDQELKGEIHARCLQAKDGRDALRSIIIEGSRVLGKPGTPGYAYYTAHPDELVRAKVTQERVLDKLPPISCKE